MSMVRKLSYLKRRDRLTTEDIAHQSGVPLGTLNKIFAGQTRNPALATMDSICRVFGVPIRYVVDDEVDDECTVTTYAENHGMFLISNDEFDLIEKCRQLSDCDRRCVTRFIEQFLLRQSRENAACEERLLPCYEPISMRDQGIFLDTWRITTLSVHLDKNTASADFAFVVPTDIYSPLYEKGTVLAVRQAECHTQELGIFFLNHLGYIRKLCYRRGDLRLVSVKSGVRDLCVGPDDDYRCMGVILGTIRQYQRL